MATSLIDNTFFEGPLNIPNIGVAYIAERVTAFSAKYEPEFLRDVLGPLLYADFATAYEGSGSEQKWLDLVSGVTYQVNGRDVVYRGLSNILALAEDATLAPVSPVANYVYWQLVKDGTTQTTGIGESVAKAENGFNVSPATKMIRAWNEMSDRVYEVWSFLLANAETYNWQPGILGGADYEYMLYNGAWSYRGPGYCPNKFSTVNSFGF